MGCFIVRTVWIIYSMVFLTWMRGIGLEAAPPAKVTIGKFIHIFLSKKLYIKVLGNYAQSALLYLY